MEQVAEPSSNLQFSILQRILDWSASQPIWQRDALRRLVEKQALSDEDIAELTTICMAEHFDQEDGAEQLTPVPLSADHLPVLEGDPVEISIIEIKDIRNTNALASDEKLTLNSEGLIVIYGDNASGKTGYVRILKKACRARASGEAILHNIHRDNPGIPASAGIGYYKDSHALNTQWTDGIPAPPELSTISVFDSASAQIQVNEANEVLFTPFGLDLLGRLAFACRRVGERLQGELSHLNQQKPLSITNNQLQSTTAAGRALTSLSHDSSLLDFQQLATLNEIEDGRHKQLKEDLEKDPVLRARQIRRQTANTRGLKSVLEHANKHLLDNAPDLAYELINDHQGKVEAARIAASERFTFDDEPLDGVGSAVWKELWEAARKYSNIVAYPDKAFPVVGEDAFCVLCFQPLSDTASARLSRFEDFLKDVTQKSAEDTRIKIEGMSLNIGGITIPESRGIIDLIGVEEPGMTLDLRLHLVRSKLRRRFLLRILKGGKPGAYPEVSIGIIDQIAGHAQKLENRAQGLEAASRSEDRQHLRDEYSELHDRVLIAELLDDIDLEINRQKRVEQYNKALSDTRTNAVTSFSTRLAKDVLNIEVQRSFTNELRNIGLATIPVELVNVGGQYGAQRFRVQLVNHPEISPHQILSNGEGRAIALAGFLAEIGIASHKSSIIFDDPVSSLDHKWRNAFARRLSQMASDRQVIVFTHDPVFLMALLEHCEKLHETVQCVHLSRRNQETGIPIEGEPWIAMPVGRRIGFLKSMLQRIEPMSESNQEVYKLKAQDLYGLLRETWERAVEEILLNQAVLRFRRSIETRRLRLLTDITDTDIQQIDAAMSKCSQYLPGHDEPAATQDTVPNPDEIAADIAVLENWVKAMRQRGRS